MRTNLFSRRFFFFSLVHIFFSLLCLLINTCKVWRYLIVFVDLFCKQLSFCAKQFLYIFRIFCFVLGTKIQTQNFALARQALCHWAVLPTHVFRILGGKKDRKKKKYSLGLFRFRHFCLYSILLPCLFY